MFTKLTLIIFTIFIIGCTNQDEPEHQDCNIVACTELYAILNVSVKDTSGVVIPLDSYEVIDNNSGENLTPNYNAQEYQYFKEKGLYPIFSDAYRLQYQNTNTSISFKGYISEEEIVSEDFVVGADCCHVSLISGNTAIVID